MSAQQTRVVMAGALFSGDGKVLLVRRVDGAGGGWELPSGVLDFGESPELGLIRVFAEATGLDVSPDRALGAWGEVEERGGVPTHTVHVGYTVRMAGVMLGVDLDPDRHGAFAWITAAEVPAHLDQPGLRQTVERAFAQLSRSRRNG